jgi:hypothetical protein
MRFVLFLFQISLLSLFAAAALAAPVPLITRGEASPFVTRFTQREDRLSLREKIVLGIRTLPALFQKESREPKYVSTFTFTISLILAQGGHLPCSASGGPRIRFCSRSPTTECSVA